MWALPKIIANSVDTGCLKIWVQNMMAIFQNRFVGIG